MGDAYVGRTGLDPELCSDLRLKLRYLVEIIFCELSGPGFLR